MKTRAARRHDRLVPGDLTGRFRDGLIGENRGSDRDDIERWGKVVTLGQSHEHEGCRQARGIALSRVWPEIESVIPAENREVAARVLVVR